MGISPIPIGKVAAGPIAGLDVVESGKSLVRDEN
jgi:hypothetical protein